jgi:biotin operon repressor
MRNKILTLLTTAKPFCLSAFEIARQLNVPQASVRRCIRELRAQGQNITTDFYGYWLA